MRRIIPILTLCTLFLLASPAAILADGLILPQSEGLGAGYPAVRSHHVTVTIDEGLAVTRVEQVFYNPYDVPLEGRYLFPLPPDAILSDFQAEVDGQPQEVTRQDAAATNAELYAGITLQRDPSLLQYADWESLAFDLSLPPGGTRRMVLEYEELLLPGSGGLYRYHYVLSTERYSSLPLEEVSLTVDLRASAGLSNLYSPGHPIQVEWLGPGQARVRWSAQDVTPGTDFELFFAPAEGGFGAGLLTGSGPGDDSAAGDHFLFLFSPQTGLSSAGALPKDVVFVLDRSGSMSGTKIEQARRALHWILDQLGQEDRFSIVGFDHRLLILDENLLPVDDRALGDARRFVNRLSADGNTDLEAALQAGLGILERSGNRGAPQMVVFLTDGLPTAGVTDESRIASLVASTNTRLESRVHVFGLGYDVNTHLLDRLAADNGGTVTYIQPGEDLEAALTGFYTQIAHPLLTGLEVEFEGMAVDDLYPQFLPDLFQGSSLLLTGRYRPQGKTVAVRVRGWAGDEQREYAYHFDLDETGLDHDFVPRLWATRRVGVLLDQVRVEGDSQALVAEIRDLGLTYGIVTPYTLFVLQAQSSGAASWDNMDLYGRSDLNAVSGETTVRARVQNQSYQQAAQAGLAAGANVSNYGSRSLAQVGEQQLDLSLLQGRHDLDDPITPGWIADNVQIDRTVEFGSESYFELAADPQARSFLQGGRDVVFEYQGQVIAVRDSAGPQQPQLDALPAADSRPAIDRLSPPARPATGAGLLAVFLDLLSALMPLALGVTLLAAVAGSALVVYLVRSRMSRT